MDDKQDFVVSDEELEILNNEEDNADRVARENLHGFYDRNYKIYLNRYVYYEVPIGKMPEVIKYLDSIALLFKPDDGELKKLLGNYKGLEEEYKRLLDAYPSW